MSRYGNMYTDNSPGSTKYNDAHQVVDVLYIDNPCADVRKM